ncbi:TIP-1 family-domain-containing protein [Crucibulum laeve]|uniref:TIP-1 family-domain-containing protein n=1 Tax=Crucibulum laeve TaxID=68775 RepID=A0A5C3LVQ6_9AGAR|nr:TIP-1 family-domain-containing protein [Crucibulum laeve]
MLSEQIRTLLQHPDLEVANREAIAYINELSVEDLSQLDTFVLNSQRNKERFNSNLSSSTFEINKTLHESKSSTNECLNSAQELSLLRHAFADELTDLSHELISSLSAGDGGPTLLEEIETLQRSLKELSSVKEYVQIVEHALKLSEAASQQIDSSSAVTLSSLDVYQSLQGFVVNVSRACSVVEDSPSTVGLHLVTFLEKIKEKTWSNIKDKLSSTLSTAAEALGWPMSVDYASTAPEQRQAFEAAFSNLMRLETINEKIHSPDKRAEKQGLYAIQALVNPVSLRFKYHFEGTRQTNRLDKPEWYFTHILNIAHEHKHFMETVAQSLLSSTEFRDINAWQEFSFLLQSILSRKLQKTVPSLLQRPSLLAHTIYQALTFDRAFIEEGFQLQNTSIARRGDGYKKWDGVSEVILGNQTWFDAWLFGEKKFTEDQYNSIISASDAWLIADEESDATGLKSTNSARRIKALEEQVTDRYSLLPSTVQRTHFLITIQLPLLEAYRERVSSSLDAFETLSSAFVRAVPGALSVSLSGRDDGTVNVDSRKLTSGVQGVERLCKALLSAAYIALSMEGWGEELFFLELWADMNQNPLLRTRIKENALLPSPIAVDATDVPQETVFEEVISRYQKLIVRAEDMIVQQVCGEVESVLRTHYNSTKSETQLEEDIALSQTLLAPIALLSSHLTFLRTTLAPATFTSLYRRIASRLAEHILQRQILYRGHFDLKEGRIICAECELWVETCNAALAGTLSGGRVRVEAPWLNLLQAGKLVRAEGEAWAKVVKATFGLQSDEEWKKIMVDVVGISNMTRAEVCEVLKRREDCGH